MIDVKRTNNLPFPEVETLIQDIDLFLSRALHEMAKAQEDRGKDYSAILSFLKQAIGTQALQPKVYALFGLHMMTMIERPSEKNEYAKAHLDNLMEQVSEQALRMMTEPLGKDMLPDDT